MKKSKIATSIAEAIIVLLIVVLWLTWVYNIFSQSVKLTDSVENKIQAIQIAREWLEAVTNIRDTNWLLFSSNTQSCWNTLNYNTSCLTWTPVSIWNNVSYRVQRNGDNRWILTEWTNSWYSNTTYRNFYRIYTDTNWLYTHWSWWNLKHIYTREIRTSYVNPWDWSSNWLRVRSIVRWIDSSWRDAWVIHEIILETILTNHKK